MFKLFLDKLWVISLKLGFCRTFKMWISNLFLRSNVSEYRNDLNLFFITWRQIESLTIEFLHFCRAWIMILFVDFNHSSFLCWVPLVKANLRKITNILFITFTRFSICILQWNEDLWISRIWILVRIKLHKPYSFYRIYFFFIIFDQTTIGTYN